MPLWARTVVAVAGAKAAFGITAFLAGFVPTDTSAVVPAWVYALVFLTLLALTATTIYVAFVDLGPLNNVVALTIAVVKTLLVRR